MSSFTDTDEDDRLPEGVARVRAANPGPLTLSGTNTYLVDEPAWVVDPGPRDEAHVERVLRAARERGGVSGIVLTHLHLDHAGAAKRLRERSGARLAAPRPVASARPLAEPSADELEVDLELAAGDRFGPLDVVATPGHSPEHLSFLTADRVLFCGDTVLGEGSVFVAPGGDSLRLYLDSLRRLRKLRPGAICPGHGPVVWNAEAKLSEYLEHRLDRERRLLAALERGLRTTDELLDAAWDDAPAELRPAAAITLEAHIEKLEREERLPEGVQRLRY